MANLGSTDLEAANSIVLAQNVQLYAAVKTVTAGDTEVDGDTKPSDRFMLMRDASFNPSLPRTRFDHGIDAGYGWAAPDVILTATVSASVDTISYLSGLIRRNAVGVPPFRQWKIIARDNGAVTITNDNTRHILMTTAMDDVNITKNDGHPGAPVSASIAMILIHGKHSDADFPDDPDNVFIVGEGVGPVESG